MSKEGKKPAEKPAVVIDGTYLQLVFVPSKEYSDCLIRIKTSDVTRLKPHQPIVIVVEK